MLVLHYVFAVVFILSARVSSSYVSRETAEVGVAICIKPAEARNEAGNLHGQYTTRLLSMVTGN